MLLYYRSLRKLNKHGIKVIATCAITIEWIALVKLNQEKFRSSHMLKAQQEKAGSRTIHNTMGGHDRNIEVERWHPRKLIRYSSGLKGGQTRGETLRQVGKQKEMKQMYANQKSTTRDIVTRVDPIIELWNISELVILT